MTMRWWQALWILGWLLSACAGDGGGALSKGNHNNVIYVGADTKPATATSTGTATSTNTTPDAGTRGEADASANVQPVGDASPGAPWTADQVFPSCTGTADQVSECIINLPSNFGTPVTSAAPMDFNACKP
jgi:hypothetical protein